MKLPYLENTAKTIQYTLCWVAFAVLQTIVFSFVLELPVWILFLDSIFNSLLYGTIGILLWAVIHYGNYAALTIYQRIINYTALGVLSIGLWVAVGYGFVYFLFGQQLSLLFIPFQPLRCLIGLLIYMLLIQRFSLLSATTNEELSSIELESETEGETDTKSQQLSSQKNTDLEILERIAVKSGTKIHVILTPEIVFLQSDGDYVQIFTSNGKYLKEQTMKYFEDRLPKSLFVRVHRSYIVNVEMISRIELYEKQNQLLTLKNGQQIKTSPAGYKALRTLLNL